MITGRARTNSAISPYYSHARQNRVIPEHAEALESSLAPSVATHRIVDQPIVA